MKTNEHTLRWLVAGLCCVALDAASAHDQTRDPDHDSDRLHGEEHVHSELEEVIVRAGPLDRNALELSQSATVLRDEALAREAGNNIGDTLARQPGLANASFGANVGRPVIRGQQGARVGVLNDSMVSGDASAVSQDHAVPTEPFLADQVEVLRGPTTLLYGSGAIGGVVNLVTNTIPAEIPELPLTGRALAQADSASGQRFAAGRLDFGGGFLAGHASAFHRRSDDYEIPGDAHLFEDDKAHEEEEPSGILENSFLDNQGGALGGAWIGEAWRAGLSWTGYESDYGIPGAHAHHGEETAGETGGAEAEEAPVTIGLESHRVEAEIERAAPISGFERMLLNITDTDYQHTEFEGDEVGTVFRNDSIAARMELKHLPWGDWQGAFGFQYGDRDFSAVGEEAFVPPSATRTRALFWVESAEYERWRLDLGLRLEDVAVQARGLERDFEPLSASAGFIGHLDERSHLAFTLSSAERAPTDQELFALGPHVATQTFEAGDAGLGEESNFHLELAWRLHQGPLTGSVSVYRDDFEDYIFQADTGQVADGLPLRRWSQQDAEFIGAEVEWRWDAGHNRGGHWQLFGFHDRLRARFADGSRVPRIPPRRLGLGFDWDHARWTGNLTWVRAAAHTDTAAMETSTPAYDLLNGELTWLKPVSDRVDVQFYFKGQNLLDEDIRHSTSFLKDQAPQVGRNYTLGVRARF